MFFNSIFARFNLLAKLNIFATNINLGYSKLVHLTWIIDNLFIISYFKKNNK